MTLSWGLFIVAWTLVSFALVVGGCDDRATSAGAGKVDASTSEESSGGITTGLTPPAKRAIKKTQKTSPPPREVICDLDNVKRILNNGTWISWDLSVSPSGQHVAVTRSVSYGANNWMHRIEIDGERGDTFRTITAGRWSEDGSTFIYAGDNFQGQMPGKRAIVHDGKRYGPYKQIVGFAISADGKSWAAMCRDSSADTPRLIVDGERVELNSEYPPIPEALRYDATARAFIYQRANTQITDRWHKLDGTEDPAPQSPAVPPGLPMPAGVTVSTVKIGKGPGAPLQLIVNGTTIGEFTGVIRRPGSPMPAWPQPDGTLIAYVVEGNKLVRLRL